MGSRRPSSCQLNYYEGYEHGTSHSDSPGGWRICGGYLTMHQPTGRACHHGLEYMPWLMSVRATWNESGLGVLNHRLSQGRSGPRSAASPLGLRISERGNSSSTTDFGLSGSASARELSVDSCSLIKLNDWQRPLFTVVANDEGDLTSRRAQTSPSVGQERS